MSIPDWLAEAERLGEVPKASAERLAALDPDELAAKRTALDADDQAFLAAHPPAEQLAAIARKAHLAKTRDAVRQRQTWMGGLTLLAVPLVAAAAFMMASPEVALNPADELEQTRLKGDADPVLTLHLRGDGVLKDGGSASEGDVIQLKVQPKGVAHVVVVSVDGRGATTLHWPAAPEASTKVVANVASIDEGYQLDDAPQFENFYLVSSSEPLDVRAILTQAGASGGGEFQVKNADVSSVHVRKEQR